jgi:hypothetical protein
VIESTAIYHNFLALLNRSMVQDKEQVDDLELLRIENHMFADQVLALDEQVQNQDRLLEARDQQLLALTNQVSQLAGFRGKAEHFASLPAQGALLQCEICQWCGVVCVRQ